MLTQPQKTIPYIGVFKLASGEEFIGKVIDENAVGYSVSMPLCLIPVEAGAQFAPFLMMGDPKQPISVPKPVITATPPDSIVNEYESRTSGIALPKKSSIIV